MNRTTSCSVPFRSSLYCVEFLVGIEGAEAEALDAGEDVVGCPGPAEGLGVTVLGLDVAMNGGLELGGGAVDAPSDLLVGELGEEPLDLIDPRGRRGGEMDVPVRAFGEPGADRLRLVGGVIVHHQMHVEIARNLGVDGAQELQELPGTVALVAAADHLAGRHVERGKQRERAVPSVVVAAALGFAGRIGSSGWVRSSAWIWLFSSTQSTSARSGGAM